MDLVVELRERFGASLGIALGITASERGQAIQEPFQEAYKASKDSQSFRESLGQTGEEVWNPFYRGYPLLGLPFWWMLPHGQANGLLFLHILY